jgi:hypothetical protein
MNFADQRQASCADHAETSAIGLREVHLIKLSFVAHTLAGSGSAVEQTADSAAGSCARTRLIRETSRRFRF